MFNSYRKSRDLKFKELPNEIYFEIILQQLEFCGRATVRVTGMSMLPFLRSEIDTVVLAPYNGEMKQDDIILYRSGTSYILHRVCSPGKTRFSMRGDNTLNIEKNLSVEDIAGIVVSVNRFGSVIIRESFKWRLYALLGKLNRAKNLVWHKIIRPVAARLYRTIMKNRK